MSTRCVDLLVVQDFLSCAKAQVLKIKDKQRLAAELGDRKSAAAQARNKVINDLAAENGHDRGGRTSRKNGKF